MNYSGKRKQDRAPLFVKEIIFPVKKKPEISNSSGTTSNHLKNVMEERGGNTLMKIGDHEVRSIGELKILVKKPSESYFEGTVEKKQIKRKISHQRATQSLKELYCRELQTESNEKESVEKDEKAERTKLQLKIEKFEKMREYRNQNSYMKQRLAEEKYIQQQENLAETWCEFMKGRNQMKQLNSDNILTYQKPIYQETSKNYSRFCIPIAPGKFWNDDQANKSSKKPKKNHEKREKEKFELTSEPSTLNDLEDRFLDKLVFVDDEDSDDVDKFRRKFSVDQIELDGKTVNKKVKSKK